MTAISSDAFEARRLHPLAAHADELGGLAGGGELLLERGDQQRAVEFAAGFACRDEDGGGHVRVRQLAAGMPTS
jgi:hypothetical protein